MCSNRTIKLWSMPGDAHVALRLGGQVDEGQLLLGERVRCCAGDAAPTSGRPAK